MQVVIAKFDCAYPEGLTSAKQRKLIRGLLDSLRSRLKCSIEYVEAHADAASDFGIGLSFVLDGEAAPDSETKFSEEVVDLIQRKGEVEVQDYLCTVVNFDDLVDQEDLVTVH